MQSQITEHGSGITDQASRITDRVRRKLALPAITFLSLALGATALAHDPGLSTATIQIKPGRLEALLVFSTTDAAQLVPVDKNDGSQLSKAQMEARKTKGAEALEIRFDDQVTDPNEVRWRFDESQNATLYLKFPAKTFYKLVMRAKCLASLPPGHRQFLSIENADGSVLDQRLLSAEFDTVTLECKPAGPGPAAPPPASRSSFLDFLLMGIQHIWTGYDHLLFLFGLLIVTHNFASSVKIITCFTIAHSITLAVATLSLVHLSSRIVEPLIAASIVYVGIENLLRGDDPKGRWMLTFAFGLIHGFGFASVLRDLGVGANGNSIAVPLVSFNLGVEVGQVVIAGVLLPVIWKLRSHPGFVRRVIPVSSTLVALLGAYWFIQRVWF